MHPINRCSVPVWVSLCNWLLFISRHALYPSQQMVNRGKMKLIKYRVTDFRSVTDSGWVFVDSVTSLIGTNESGKTNLLLPVWKLNPAKGGQINPTADYPRKRYTEIRNMPKKPVFITAEFELSDKLVAHLSRLTGKTQEQVRIMDPGI